MPIDQQETPTPAQFKRFSRHRLPERQLTAIESRQLGAIREMAKQLILARECLNRGDSEGYANSYARARAICDAAKCRIEHLFELYCGELINDRS